MKVSSFAVLILSATAISPLAYAHGSLETPISRIYNCYQEGPENPKSAACKAFMTGAVCAKAKPTATTSTWCQTVSCVPAEVRSGSQ
jgi:predicted carbohydrate-binding protein with CBM5 and CBM33 domain